jgi:hypothetical protein
MCSFPDSADETAQNRAGTPAMMNNRDEMSYTNSLQLNETEAANNNNKDRIYAGNANCLKQSSISLLFIENQAPIENRKKDFAENPGIGIQRSMQNRIPVIRINKRPVFLTRKWMSGVNMITTIRSRMNQVGSFMGVPAPTAIPNRFVLAGWITPYRHLSQKILIHPRSFNRDIRSTGLFPFIICPAFLVIMNPRKAMIFHRIYGHSSVLARLRIFPFQTVVSQFSRSLKKRYPEIRKKAGTASENRIRNIIMTDASYKPLANISVPSE